jgi:hypothetical protein
VEPRRVSLDGLGDLQRRFRAVVLGDEDAPLQGLVRSPGMSVAGRIDIYRNTVQTSLADVLATAFPVVQRVVGEAFFAGLVRRFITAAPPTVPNLSVYGAGLPAFIAGDDVSRQLPYLADVARLEWARGEAYFAADAPLLDPASLAARSPEEIDRAALTAHPAVRLVCARFPIFRIWQVNQPDVSDVPPVAMDVAENVIVSRPGHHVVTRAVTAPDAAFVAQVLEGAALGRAAAKALELDDSFDLQAALTEHFVNGSFRA